MDELSDSPFTDRDGSYQYLSYQFMGHGTSRVAHIHH